jgi:hypothetical protein
MTSCGFIKRRLNVGEGGRSTIKLWEIADIVAITGRLMGNRVRREGTSRASTMRIFEFHEDEHVHEGTTMASLTLLP